MMRFNYTMRLFHKLMPLLAVCVFLTPTSAEAETVLKPESRQATVWWQKRYEEERESLKSKPCQVLLLGDSITDFWNKNGQKVWEKELMPYQPCNFGISGDQTSNLLFRIVDSGLPASQDPGLCVLMIGTNNTGIQKCGESPEKTALDILNITEHLLLRFPTTHVVVFGIFPRGDDPQDPLRVHNDKINDILSSCKLPRMEFVNINNRFLDKKTGRLIPEVYVQDKLHLSEKGYAVWAKALRPYLHQYCKP